MAPTHHPLALVTASSSGIGLQLAHQCAGAGFDLVIAADRPLDFAMKVLTDRGAAVEALEADLSTTQGVDALLARLVDRRVDALIANVGACPITSTLYLIRSLARSMRKRGQGKILITGFEATHGMKAIIDAFLRTLRNELKDSGVTVSCLMPGITDSRFFAPADVMRHKGRTSGSKVDLVDVARIGFTAMIDGEREVVQYPAPPVQARRSPHRVFRQLLRSKTPLLDRR